jgi:hypothetical protein
MRMREKTAQFRAIPAHFSQNWRIFRKTGATRSRKIA